MFEPTPAMIMGSLIHSLILEPETVDEKYIVWSDGARKGKAYNEFKSVAVARNLEIIKADEMADAINVRDAVLDHPIAGDIVRSFVSVEKSVEWLDPMTGVRCRGYIDGEGDTFIADLKSTASNDPDEFMRSCYKEKYPLQASMYLDAINNDRNPSSKRVDKFYIIAFEKSAPYHVMVFEATQTFIAYGDAIKARLMKAFKDWNGQLSGREFHSGVDINPLSIPRYSKIEPYFSQPDAISAAGQTAE